MLCYQCSLHLFQLETLDYKVAGVNTLMAGQQKPAQKAQECVFWSNTLSVTPVAGRRQSWTRGGAKPPNVA